jgi:TRAP-type C4-dicarboxylate transport system permease small subunit
MRHAFRLHDCITTFGAVLSVVCLGVICFSYCYEVVSRYFFNAPTIWVAAVTVYLLLVSVTLMAPYVTRQRGHVTITFVLERVGVAHARYLLAGCIVLSAIVCLLSVWFTGAETLRQFESGTTMMDSLLLTPKWVLSALIVYGFLSSAFYFLRQVPGALKGEIVMTDGLDVD